MRSIALICTLAGTAFAGHVHGKVVRDRVAGPLDVRISVDGGPFHHERAVFDLDVPDGTHVVTIAGPTFQTVQPIVTVKGALDLKIIDVDSGRRIYGRVADLDGTSVPDATVIAYADGIANPFVDEDTLLRQGAHLGTTFVDGTFAIDGFPEDAVVKVRAFARPALLAGAAVPNGNAGSIDGVRRSIVELAPPHTGCVNLVVAEVGSIAGRVKDRKKLRTPAVIAQAVIPGEPAQVPILGGVDPTGAFRFDDLPAGTYDVAFSDEIGAPTRVVVPAGGEIEAVMTAPRGHGDIVVAAPDCTIATLEAGTEATLVTGICDQGHAIFQDVAFGAYRVCVDGDRPCEAVTVKAKRATVKHMPPPIQDWDWNATIDPYSD
ncbi:MAG: hypothetical protein QM831_05630 [Kofleriaceae bacterium]